MNRKRDPEATKTAILDASERLFLADGFSAVSTTAIAKEAGVTKSLIHHHFGGKEDLWDEVKARFFRDYFNTQMAMLETAPPNAQLLRDSMISYFRYLQAKPEFPRMMAHMLLEGDDACTDLNRELIRVGVQRIQEGQEHGSIRKDLSPDNILIAFLSLIENWFFSRKRFIESHFIKVPTEQKNPQKLDEAYLADILTIFFDGICPPSNAE